MRLESSKKKIRKVDLLGFKSWEGLLETKDLVIDNIKAAIDELLGGMEHHIPNFVTFTRPGEPLQHSHIFSDKDGNNMSFNITKAGQLFSVDLWKKNDTMPFVTLYSNNSEVADVVRVIAEKFGKHQAVSENTTRHSKVTAVEPKERTEIHEPIQIAEEYDFSDPKTIFKDLCKYTDMVAKGVWNSLLVTGSPGVGKSYQVQKELGSMGLVRNKDYYVIKGKASAAGMYITMYNYNGSLIIFDDCDSVFDDDNGIMLLKGALDTDEPREISWTGGKTLKDPTSGKGVPVTFEFTGRVIFISNKSRKNLSVKLGAIKSRAFMLEVALSPADMLKYIQDLLPAVMPEESMPLKRLAFKVIQTVASNNRTVDLNLRTLQKAIKILKYNEDPTDAKRMIIQ